MTFEMPSEALERLVRERLQARWPYALVNLSPESDGVVLLRAELTLVSRIRLSTAMLEDALPAAQDTLSEALADSLTVTMERVLRDQLASPAVDVHT